MAEDTKIQWADKTFNPWRGCTKYAAGCKFCYADAQSKRNPGTLGIWGDNGTRVVAAESMWKQPHKWNRDAKADFDLLCAEGREYEFQRPRVFCASLADVFEDWQGPMVDSQGRFQLLCSCLDDDLCLGDCPNVTMHDVRRRLFATIDATPYLDWLLVTKRPENVWRMWQEVSSGLAVKNIRKLDLPAMGEVDRSNAITNALQYRENAWLLTSVSEQETANRNIPELLKCRDLSPVLGVSYEPALGPVDWRNPFYGIAKERQSSLDLYDMPGGEPDECYRAKPAGLDWLIAGGESGPNARPCNVDWIRSTVEQCRDAGTACFVKQLGANPRRQVDTAIKHQPGWESLRLSDPKGGDPSEWPEELRVREFPR